MTLPQERSQAILNTREFLLLLLRSPSDGGWKLPAEVRRIAKNLLRHYPTSFDMQYPHESLEALMLLQEEAE